MSSHVYVADEVAQAVRDGVGVVALESTLLAHGLPRPRNLDVGRELERVVRDAGAVPATVGVVGGRAVVGLDERGLETMALGEGVAKASVRDLPAAVATGRSAATTVAATARLARLAGVRVFATGGLGGVHRDAATSFDESADLLELARTDVTVVCAGVKSILDVRATLERLETLGVPVVGYGTDRFPGFYLADSGHLVDWRADDPETVARMMLAAEGLGLRAGLVLGRPVADQMDPDLHDRVLREAEEAADLRGLRGSAVTPFMLDYFHRATDGVSLDVNVRIVRSNAELAARIAVAWERLRTSGGGG